MPDVTVRLPSPYAAYLRVYEPLDAFPAEERAAWRRYAGQAPGRPDLLAVEQHRSRADLLRLPPRPVPGEESDDAFVLVVDDEVLVCPVQSRLRAWVALREFRTGMPAGLLHAFVPRPAVEQAELDHDVWGDKETQPLRIRTVACGVPVHWFVAFCSRDRHLSLGDGERSVVYRARMSAARRRVGRALRTLRRSVEEVGYADYVVELEEMGRWLEEFHPRAWLELDYGGLANLVPADRLRADTSAKDVAAALAALAAGDPRTAARTYETLVERWADVRALERVN